MIQVFVYLIKYLNVFWAVENNINKYQIFISCTLEEHFVVTNAFCFLLCRLWEEFMQSFLMELWSRMLKYVFINSLCWISSAALPLLLSILNLLIMYCSIVNSWYLFLSVYLFLQLRLSLLDGFRSLNFLWFALSLICTRFRSCTHTKKKKELIIICIYHIKMCWNLGSFVKVYGYCKSYGYSATVRD